MTRSPIHRATFHDPARRGPTEPVGLYDPRFEHDSCGVAIVARLNGVPTHETIRRAITALENLEHRGATGADARTGDGAGILIQLPDEFFRSVVAQELPPAGQYGVAVCFLPRDEPARAAELEQLLVDTVAAEGQRVVCWRDVPLDLDQVGVTAAAVAPTIKQLVVAASPALAEYQDAFERKLYVIRRVAELAAGPDLVIPSFSSRTIVYKGMLMSPQLEGCFPDLQSPLLKSALALDPLALLDQHLPELGARAPVPHGRPQRGDQHRARQRQLDACTRVAACLRALRRRPREGAAGRAPRRIRHGELRQRARAARARRPLAAACADDDDPRGVRGAHRRERRAARLLRLPRLPDGALGRARVDLVQRRHPDRRDARPQRPAPRSLARDEGRLGRARLRGGRARRSAGERAPQRPSPARQALPRRPRPGPHRRRLRGEARDRDPQTVRGVVRNRRRPSLGSASAATQGAAGRASASPSARVRLHAGGPARDPGAAREECGGADRLDGERPRARGALRPAARSSTPTSSSSSRR